MNSVSEFSKVKSLNQDKRLIACTNRNERIRRNSVNMSANPYCLAYLNNFHLIPLVDRPNWQMRRHFADRGEMESTCCVGHAELRLRQQIRTIFDHF